MNISLVSHKVVDGNVFREKAFVASTNLRSKKDKEVWIACYRRIERLNKRSRPEGFGQVGSFTVLEDSTNSTTGDLFDVEVKARFWRTAVAPGQDAHHEPAAYSTLNNLG